MRHSQLPNTENPRVKWGPPGVDGSRPPSHPISRRKAEAARKGERTSRERREAGRPSCIVDAVHAVHDGLGLICKALSVLPVLAVRLPRRSRSPVAQLAAQERASRGRRLCPQELMRGDADGASTVSNVSSDRWHLSTAICKLRTGSPHCADNHPVTVRS
jgi:hypothetical protein